VISILKRPWELGQALGDVFGFGFRSGEPEKGIVGIPAIAQPPIAQSVGICAGNAAHPLT
jgi:hypothetical protein